jgi:hypothetical protein
VKADRMATNVNRLAYLLKKNGVINSTALFQMQQVASNIQSFDPKKWELNIVPNESIEFAEAENDPRVKPDISCSIKVNNNNGWLITDLNVLLRVWSTRANVCFRDTWDSQHVKRKLDALGSCKRVMFRCHFDKCNLGQVAPIFHLQFGGDPEDNEYYWFPHNLELPRFPSPPIDLVLGCELIVATFFPTVYRDLCQDGTWISIIQESEKFFAGKFYKTCHDHIDRRGSEEKTLLHHISSL